MKLWQDNKSRQQIQEMAAALARVNGLAVLGRYQGGHATTLALDVTSHSFIHWRLKLTWCQLVLFFAPLYLSLLTQGHTQASPRMKAVCMRRSVAGLGEEGKYEKQRSARSGFQCVWLRLHMVHRSVSLQNSLFGLWGDRWCSNTAYSQA